MRFKNYRYFAEGLDFHTAFVYNIIVQLNKESCPSWPKEHDWKSCNGDKPFEGSNPLLSAKKSDKFRLVGFFYPLRKQWHIISRQAVYHQGWHCHPCISSPKVYQAFAMMICNSCRIDDIQCCALILTKLYSIIITKEVVICLQITCLCILNSWQPI